MKLRLQGMRGEACRFCIVGVCATAVHYAIYYGLTQVADVLVNVAYAVGYLLSFIFNFYATARFTFHASPTWKRLWGMTAAHGVNCLLHILLLNLFLWAKIPEAWAPIPVFAIAVPFNFLFVRFAFKQRKDKK